MISKSQVKKFLSEPQIGKTTFFKLWLGNVHSSLDTCGFIIIIP